MLGGGFVHNATPTSCVKAALRWLQDCACLQEQCGNHIQRLPTQLIDVATYRLIEQSHLSANTAIKPYACLSHCWGAADQASSVLRTTASTLASYKESLPIAKLPRTFRQAIDFTRALGIPYLWVDSLCIIQDDRSDWEQEAAAMADIYTNCFVTIAASASEDSEGGLFAEQDVGYCKVGSLHCNDGDILPLCMRKEPIHFPQAKDYPLARRGWLLQERLLSPRTIYFLGTELMFECQEGIQCQCGALSQVACIKAFDLTSSFGWSEIMYLYSYTSLTFRRDALPALSGLAKQWLNAHPDDTYLAGL
jgi:hypothetical protein